MFAHISLILIPVVLFFFLAPGFLTVPKIDDKYVHSPANMKTNWKTWIVHTGIFTLLWLIFVFILNRKWCVATAISSMAA